MSAAATDAGAGRDQQRNARIRTMTHARRVEAEVALQAGVGGKRGFDDPLKRTAELRRRDWTLWPSAPVYSTRGLEISGWMPR